MQGGGSTKPVAQLTRLYTCIAISVLPGTHFHLSQVKHLKYCLAQGHNIETMSKHWEGRDITSL